VESREPIRIGIEVDRQICPQYSYTTQDLAICIVFCLPKDSDIFKVIGIIFQLMEQEDQFSSIELNVYSPHVICLEEEVIQFPTIVEIRFCVFWKSMSVVHCLEKMRIIDLAQVEAGDIFIQLLGPHIVCCNSKRNWSRRNIEVWCIQSNYRFPGHLRK